MNTKPHLCPKCDGERTVWVPDMTAPKTCPVCIGEGVLWSPVERHFPASPVMNESLPEGWRMTESDEWPGYTITTDEVWRGPPIPSRGVS